MGNICSVQYICSVHYEKMITCGFYLSHKVERKYGVLFALHDNIFRQRRHKLILYC